LPKNIKEPERTWFAVGAYNIGLKHILAAYRSVAQAGNNPNLWDNVSSILPQLYGEPFSRGSQAKQYVARIQVFAEILRFYDIHLRESHAAQTVLIANNKQD
jgi:membrane-bound lytic murein transglycosylase F